MSGRVVLAGNVIVDVVIEVPHLPERGGDVIGTGTGATPGGGFNTLVAARRLDAEAVYAGLHGTGPYGELVRKALADEHIAALLPARTDRDSGFTVALIDSGGERTFVTSFGAEATQDAADTAAITADLCPDDLVQLSGYGLVLPGNGPLLSRLAATLPSGATLCLDPGPLVADIPESLLSPVLARTDWLSVNAREARIMTGRDDLRDAATALGQRLAPEAGVLVRADKDGCLLATAGQLPTHVPGFPVTSVDSNGAGDAHTGAFLALLGQGHDPFTAAHAANAAAAYAVTQRGPATAPSRTELVEFLGDHPLAEKIAGPRTR